MYSSVLRGGGSTISGVLSTNSGDVGSFLSGDVTVTGLSGWVSFFGLVIMLPRSAIRESRLSKLMVENSTSTSVTALKKRKIRISHK